MDATLMRMLKYCLNKCVLALLNSRKLYNLLCDMGAVVRQETVL